MEGKLVCYLKWINMYSSAGSNQGHNRFSLKNKFALGILEMMTLFFQLDPPECIVLSPCGRLLIVLATLTRGQISTGGVVGRSLHVYSLYSELSLALDVRTVTRPVTFFKMKPDGFSVTFWTLILQGFFISPSQYLYLFSWTSSKALVWSLTWDMQVPVSFFCLLVGHKG